LNIVRRAALLILATVLASSALSQQRFRPTVDVQPVVDAERQFEAVAAAEGIKYAFLKFLAPDSIIFRPAPVNGIEYWNSSTDPASLLLSRNVTYADVAANGVLGYTTGNWRLYERNKSEAGAKFGQYVTVWEKRPDGRFHATIDIGITHEKLPFAETDKPIRREPSRDPNKRGWSPADASMKFTRLSMAPGALSGAFEQYAADDIRLLLDNYPPIIGKKRAMAATKHYLSIRFPQKIALFQAADMAYTWNACQFANSQEGMEQGNCLQIWKLHNKKWSIVLSIFARVPNEMPPVLKDKSISTSKQRP
jgi:hypothetical protein